MEASTQPAQRLIVVVEQGANDHGTIYLLALQNKEIECCTHKTKYSERIPKPYTQK